MSDIAIYKSNNGDIKVDVTFKDETIWLSQAQLSYFTPHNTRVIIAV